MGEAEADPQGGRGVAPREAAAEQGLRGGLGRWPTGPLVAQRLAEVDHNRKLAAYLPATIGGGTRRGVPLAELTERPAQHLLVHLGELPANGAPRLGERVGQRLEAPREAVTGLKGHHHAAAAPPLVQRRLQVAGAARKVPDEAKGVAGEAGGHQGREHGGGAGQNNHLYPLLDRPGHQANAGILHARHSGVAHERHVLPSQQALQNLLGPLRLVVAKEADHRRADAEVREELARMARVLGRDELRGGERLEHARRHVPQVADRCGTDSEHTPLLLPLAARTQYTYLMTTDRPARPTGRIILGDNLEVLRSLPDGIARLIYIDPPFNTGGTLTRRSIRTVRDDEGDRVGFSDRRYRTEQLGSIDYPDAFDDYLGFLRPRLLEASRILTPDGSLFFHIDCRESHYCKVLLDEIFGRRSFKNEIIWAYDYGGRPKNRWPAKHDTIFWYTKNPTDYVFAYEAIDRIPYMAPSLVGAEKAARGKTPTDVWWNTIVSPTGKEKTGYPTQKPLRILERIVKVHSEPGDLVVDFFAGSGTTGEAAARCGRNYLLVDESPEALRVMAERLAWSEPTLEGVQELEP